MFGIGSTEILVIIVVALVVLGPKSLPGIAKTVGKVMGEFRKVTTEFQRTMNAEVAQDEHEKLKKEAEEELFGDEKKDVATTSKTAPKEAQAEAKGEQVAEEATENKDTTVNVDSNSPLAQAVAKAEAEATEEANNEAKTEDAIVINAKANTAEKV